MPLPFLAAPIAATAIGFAVKKYKEKVVNDATRTVFHSYQETRTAEFEIKMEELSKKFQNIAEDHVNLSNMILASVAIGIAAARCDGEITDQEKKAIQLITAGISYNSLPVETLDTINLLYLDPPSLSQAFLYVEKVDKSKWDSFDDVVRYVLMADRTNNQEKANFKAAWESLKRVA